ncbi:hypothetical protein KEM55_007096 [Ascosphaera atra]|nr:hypothetical protein KEM55_007096 [Ascosphaera atra]
MFGWPSLEKPANRVSPLGANWSSPVAWSRSQSRRPSVHLSSANHLPLLPDAETDDIMQPPSQTVQAPIGTRPPSSRHNGNAPSTPKLNPAAPSFKTIFSKRLEKVRSKDSSESLRDHDESATDDYKLPPSRRGSHSARSIQASIAESNESLGPTKSLTPSETSNRESFIQRLSRRSSSSRFSLSWKDRGSLFSRKESSTSSERLPQSELDEESASDAIRKNSESAASVSKGGDGTRRGSSFFRRKSRKAEKATNEITDDEDAAAGNAV